LIGAVALPLLAVALPLLLALGHLSRGGPWTYVLEIDPWTVQIYDVFTESVPFMVAAAIVGLAAPAAGVLLVLAYGASDLVVTVLTGELQPIPGALAGRLVSYALLWLLAVEIPLLGRQLFESVASSDAAPRARRTMAVLIAAIGTGALVYVWTHGARLLIGAVYYPTGTGLTPPPAFVVLLDNAILVAAAIGAAALVIFGVRYLGASAHIGASAIEPGPLFPRGSPLGYIASLAVAFFILLALYDKPIDAVILIAGLLLARPVARFVLSVTRSARVLARIPWPIRLLAGFVATLAFAAVFLGIVGISPLSRLGNMVIAVAVGLVIMEIFLAADEVADASRESAARRVAEGLTVGILILLALPAVALGDNGEAAADLSAAAAAAGAAATAAAASRRRPKERPMIRFGPARQVPDIKMTMGPAREVPDIKMTMGPAREVPPDVPPPIPSEDDDLEDLELQR
jgi:hypothetical protein